MGPTRDWHPVALGSRDSEAQIFFHAYSQPRDLLGKGQSRTGTGRSVLGAFWERSMAAPDALIRAVVPATSRLSLFWICSSLDSISICSSPSDLFHHFLPVCDSSAHPCTTIEYRHYDGPIFATETKAKFWSYGISVWGAKSWTSITK